MGKNLYSKLGFLLLSFIVPLASCNTPTNNTNVINSSIKIDPFSNFKNNTSNLSKGKGFRVKSTKPELPLSCYQLEYSSYYYLEPESSIVQTSFGKRIMVDDPNSPDYPYYPYYFYTIGYGNNFHYAIYSDTVLSFNSDAGYSGGFDMYMENGKVVGDCASRTGWIGFYALGNFSISNGFLTINASNPSVYRDMDGVPMWSGSFSTTIKMPLVGNYKSRPECDPWSIELSGSDLTITDNKPVDVTVTPSEADRYWVLTVTGAGGYLMSYKDIGSKTISIPDSVSLPHEMATYTAEVHYEERTDTKAVATFVFIPPSDPTSPTPDPTVDPTSTPTSKPTPSPTPTPPVCPDGSIEIPNYKDSNGKPLCCPNANYFVCGVFSNPRTNPSFDPSANPSNNPTSNPSSPPSPNPSIIPTSNPSVNPSSSPSSNPSDANKKRGQVIIANYNRIVSTVVDNPELTVLVSDLPDDVEWVLKIGSLELATGTGPQMVKIHSTDLNKGLPAGSYLEDGYYYLYLNINHAANDLLAVDNTPPKISVDETKSTVSDNGDVNLTLKIEDPMVNGVSSGLDSTTLPNSILGSDGSSVSLAYIADTSTSNQDMQAYFPSGFGVASLKTPKKSISVTGKIHVNKKKGFKLKSVEDSLEEARVTFILGLANSETKIADKVKNTDYCYVGK